MCQTVSIVDCLLIPAVRSETSTDVLRSMNYSLPIAIGVGGFFGAVVRHYLATAIGRASGLELSFLGTLTVNLIGCFFIGVLAAVATRSEYLSPVMQKCLITGLLGSLTTFSTFALDILNLLHEGRLAASLGYVLVSVAAGLLLVWLGMETAARFLPVSE